MYSLTQTHLDYTTIHSLTYYCPTYATYALGPRRSGAERDREKVVPRSKWVPEKFTEYVFGGPVRFPPETSAQFISNHTWPVAHAQGPRVSLCQDDTCVLSGRTQLMGVAIRSMHPILQRRRFADSRPPYFWRLPP